METQFESLMWLEVIEIGRGGLVSRWSAPLGRLPVRAGSRVLGRKHMIVTGN